MKKRKPQTDTDPRVGDRVRLVSERSLRKDEMDLQGQTGEVIECSDGKRFASRTAGCSWEGTLNCLSVPKGDCPSTILSANWLRCVSLAPTLPDQDGDKAAT